MAWVSVLGCGCLSSASVFVATRDSFVHFTYIVLYFVVFSLCFKINIMDTYHAAFWSSDPSRFSSSEEEDEVRYTSLTVSDCVYLTVST